ncbi:hypothetical protein [Haloarcula amylolytica]|uniref:hypothetical protein n=1 Tax=Haloarcula amylolytica TaxID=396317 RepID=UPI003C7479EA
MQRNQNPDNDVARSEWISDEQEVARLVEDFVSSDMFPPEIVDEAKTLHDSGHPYQALRVFLDSLD